MRINKLHGILLTMLGGILGYNGYLGYRTKSDLREIEESSKRIRSALEQRIKEEDPYAFRQTKEYQSFFNEVKWDFSLLSKEGDTLESLAEEIYGDRTKWKEIFDNNNFDWHFRRSPWMKDWSKERIEEFKKEHLFNDSTDTSQPLPLGQKLLIYLSFSEKKKYVREHPERKIDYWSHPP